MFYSSRNNNRFFFFCFYKRNRISLLRTNSHSNGFFFRFYFFFLFWWSINITLCYSSHSRFFFFFRQNQCLRFNSSNSSKSSSKSCGKIFGFETGGRKCFFLFFSGSYVFLKIFLGLSACIPYSYLKIFLVKGFFSEKSTKGVDNGGKFGVIKDSSIWIEFGKCGGQDAKIIEVIQGFANAHVSQKHSPKHIKGRRYLQKSIFGYFWKELVKLGLNRGSI